MENFLYYVLGVALLFVILWKMVLKSLLPYLGERNILFTTIKKGRIKCIILGQKILGYYCNLEDLGFAVIRETGKMVEAEDESLKNSILWNSFGVIWMGFGGKPFSYEFLNTESGKYLPAESIWFKNQMIMTFNDVECHGGVRLNLKIQIILKTTHAGYALNYRDWPAVVESQVSSVVRDFLSNKMAEVILQEKIEEGSELFQKIMDINKPDSGNKPLSESVGQEVVGFSVISMDYASDFKATMEAEKRAEKERLAKMKEVQLEADTIKIIAKAKLVASDNEAKATKKLGSAENEVIQETALHLGQQGAANLRQAKEIREAVKAFRGSVLSLNGTNVPVVVDTKDLQPPKEV